MRRQSMNSENVVEARRQKRLQLIEDTKEDMLYRRSWLYNENLLQERYASLHGLKATQEGFQQWRYTSEGRAAVLQIVDAQWKHAGKKNPNPRKWDTSVTWKGKKV